jgi:hypothetical protein
MELEIKVRKELDEAIMFYRGYFRDADSSKINSFMDDEGAIGSYWVGRNQDPKEQELLYKARMRAAAQALKELPLADQHWNAIFWLEKLGDDTLAVQDVQVKRLVDSFFDSIADSDPT